jgi:hypothetical protein
MAVGDASLQAIENADDDWSIAQFASFVTNRHPARLTSANLSPPCCRSGDAGVPPMDASLRRKEI